MAESGEIVSLGKFGNKLKKELARNKAKSAALGIACLVALFFWGPLLANWFSGDATEAVEPTQVSLETSASSPTFTAPAAPEDTKRVAKWNDVLKLIKNDNLMLSAELSKSQFDPFRSFASVEAEAVPEIDITEPPDIEQSSSIPKAVDSSFIERLQISLQSVYFGTRKRRAKINGVYIDESKALFFDRESGRMLVNDAEVQAARLPLQFELAEIHPKHVVLKSGERERKVELERTDYRSSSK